MSTSSLFFNVYPKAAVGVITAGKWERIDYFSILMQCRQSDDVLNPHKE